MRATLVGRVATPVITASGTQPTDQGWGKNYGIAKSWLKVVEASKASPLSDIPMVQGLAPLRTEKELGISVETGLAIACPGMGGFTPLKGFTPGTTSSHGLTESDMVINLKPELELEYSQWHLL